MIEPLNKSPCDTFLTNKEYLIHMINHHQVAVDISIDMLKISKNPIIQEILRKLIWTQNREIAIMKNILNSLPINVSNSELNVNAKYKKTNLDFTHYAYDSNAECNAEFFDPVLHKEKLKYHKLNDKMYLEHMIPHHQVAVDMSKNLLKNTNNDFMISFAYKIIRNQQEEINYMNQILQNLNQWHWKSELIN